MAGTADLGALVITLRAEQALTIQQHMGRAAQKLCLDLVRQVDPDLADELHATCQVKPYAVSGLLQPGATHPVTGAIAVGDRAWVRLVGLRADVVAALDGFAKTPPEVVTFDRRPWRVEQVTWCDHPWAGQTSYQELAIRAQRANPSNSLTLEFATPTAFSSADLNIPLPDPMRVFDSLRAQWAALPTGFALPEALMEFVRRFVPLTEFRAHSEILMLKTPEIGFCANRVRYTIKPLKTVSDNQRAKKPGEAHWLDTLNAQHDDLARAIALLTEFAFYSGVGIKTTTGMGMVRRI